MEKLHRNSLSEEATFILEESRIVVPGVQALFGFQLIAVFNSVFHDQLSYVEQLLHLVAILSVTISMALVLSPAALHRMSEPGEISDDFLRRCARFLEWAMVFLPIGICLDLYIILNLVTASMFLSLAVAVSFLCFFLFLWFIYPKEISKAKGKIESKA
jgi:hypothetical protein